MTPGPGMHRTPLPLGFLAAGVNSGVRRYRPDLGIIFTESDSVVAGVFTVNEAKAAPVRYCQEILPGQKIRAIVTNSGQANAATGPEGVLNNVRMAQSAARALGVKPAQVLTASTGVIGQRLEIEKIEGAMTELIARSSNVAEHFALAILTTDLVPKTVTTVITLSTGSVRITGIAKGSGMIHPNMATMLGYLLTDAELSPELAQALLKSTVDDSFNMISVDGDSSTNDGTFLMASGASGVCLVSAQDQTEFQQGLLRISQFLAQAIAADGEGATKLIEVELKGAPELDMARRAARSLTLSSLIKTAIHGEDPNWGRILARLGAEQVPVALLDKMILKLQGHVIFAGGMPVDFDRVEVKASMRDPKVHISIDFRSGVEQALAWGCDLSKRYVDINTEYS